jgi:hypothetical protein
MFAISSNALRAREYFNLARDEALRLHKTPLLINFVTDWLVK